MGQAGPSSQGTDPQQGGGRGPRKRESSGEEGAEPEQRRDLGNLATGGVSQSELRCCIIEKVQEDCKPGGLPRGGVGSAEVG